MHNIVENQISLSDNIQIQFQSKPRFQPRFQSQLDWSKSFLRAIYDKNRNIIERLLQCDDIKNNIFNNPLFSQLLRETYPYLVQLYETQNLSHCKNKYSNPYSNPSLCKSHIMINNKTFMEIIKSGNIENIKYMIENGIDPSSDDNNAIKQACCDGQLHVVNLLLSYEKVDPTTESNTAFRLAVRNDHYRIVEILISKNVNPADENNYAIKYASKQGYYQLVDILLLDSRVCPDIDNNYPIRKSSKFGHTQIVQSLLKNKWINPGANKNYSIRWAANNGHLLIVKLLVDDIRVDASSVNNESIKLASMGRHTKIVKKLISVNIVDPSVDDNCIIKYVATYGYLDIVQLLLSSGKINLCDNQLKTLMTEATNNGFHEIAKLFDEKLIVQFGQIGQHDQPTIQTKTKPTTDLNSQTKNKNITKTRSNSKTKCVSKSKTKCVSNSLLSNYIISDIKNIMKFLNIMDISIKDAFIYCTPSDYNETIDTHHEIFNRLVKLMKKNFIIELFLTDDALDFYVK